MYKNEIKMNTHSTEELSDLCLKVDLILLEKSYLGFEKKHRVICSKGHVTYKTYRDIKVGTGCKECKGEKIGNSLRKSIEDLKIIEEKANLTLLSTTYIGARDKVKWKCNTCGYEWEAEPYSILGAIKRGTNGCKKCSNRFFDIDLLNEIIEKKEGRLIEVIQNKNPIQLIVQCKYDHKFTISSSLLKKEKWCPSCSEYLGEKVCRFYFEEFLGKPFPKIRPKWLRSSFGTLLELDGYNEELKLAFEHNGEQHYSLTTHYITDPNVLEKRFELDKQKMDLCQKNKICLIIITEVNNKIPLSEIGHLIYNKIIENNFTPTKTLAEVILDPKKVYYPNDHEMFQKLENYAIDHKGKIIDQYYKGYEKKYSFECEKGHIFETSIRSLLHGKSWCPICNGGIRKNIDFLHELAQKLNITCLSTKYISSKSKYTWECSNGHIWDASIDSIQLAIKSRNKNGISNGCKECHYKNVSILRNYGK